MGKRVFFDKDGNPVEVYEKVEKTSVWVHLIWALATVTIVGMICWASFMGC